MSRDIHIPRLKKSVLQQILVLFFSYLVIGFLTIWLFDFFLMDRSKSFGYYVFDAATLSLVLTVVFKGKAIKTLIVEREQPEKLKNNKF